MRIFGKVIGRKPRPRRPTWLEVDQALLRALLFYTLTEEKDARYEVIHGFLTGPFQGCFLRELNDLVNAGGEIAFVDPQDGLLIKRG